MVYTENNLIDSDDGMYLTVDSLKERSNIITGSNNINLRKISLKPYGFDKMYMDKELKEDKIYQLIDQVNENKSRSAKLYSTLLSKIHPFHDENGRTCKTLFANGDIIRQNI